MTVFSELYSAYYNAVSAILRAAVSSPLSRDDIRRIIEENAFGESVLGIEPAISEERWQLIMPDGTTPLRNAPTMPRTTLEKRWLKAVYADPRIRLFADETEELADVEPLFGPEDFCVFDKYSDGDPFGDEEYIKRFRQILDAVRSGTALRIDMTNRKGGITHMTLLPDHLEYSEKDDKFRLIGLGCRYGGTVNLGRIVSCEPYTKPFKVSPSGKARPKTEVVEFELTDRRNALERALMHFAHFKKEARRLEADRYSIRVTYDKDDETELVIRILSFGPLIKVTEPQEFAELIKNRLKDQKNCGL